MAIGLRAIASLFVFLHLVVIASHADDSDAQILLRFKDSLSKTNALSDWDVSRPPCNENVENWVGVLCENGKVWGLQLESMGLEGIIDVETLSKLRDLRTISFANNSFNGSLPDLRRLDALKAIFFSNNKFSGQISKDAFGKMMYLKKLHLANNRFSGEIPFSLASLPRLMELSIENNEFEGDIPGFAEGKLVVFNVSHNRLTGEIPRSLHRFTKSSFEGNAELCGSPLEQCTYRTPSTGTMIKVGILTSSAISALIAVVIILRRHHKASPQNPDTMAHVFTIASHDHIKGGPEAAMLEQAEYGKTSIYVMDSKSYSSSSPERVDKKRDRDGKLTFLVEDRVRFDMSDLLKASAEILGSGVCGSTYKAALNNKDGILAVVVVKRYSHMNNLNREEFNEHMRILGGLRHQNLLPVVAFYYRKEEKLLVSDYVENSSLAIHLHGNKSRGIPSLDWPTRLRIVKGIARGLQHLYDELPSLTTPHGHLKSSNVLLDHSFNPLLANYALVPVINQEHAHEHMVAYKSPEHKHTNRITKKTDVWSLGILILEVLTGRFPSNLLQQGRGNEADLTTWVDSVVRSEDCDMAEVFDGDMEGVTKDSEGEMMKLLKIGLMCCCSEVEKRIDIREAVERIEEVKEKQKDLDCNEEFYSSYGGSEADTTRSSRGLSDDFNVVFK